MAKLSSYQKLKAEKQKLIEDIYTLTMLSDSEKPDDAIKYWGVKTNWNVRFSLENLIWCSSADLEK